MFVSKTIQKSNSEITTQQAVLLQLLAHYCSINILAHLLFCKHAGKLAYIQQTDMVVLHSLACIQCTSPAYLSNFPLPVVLGNLMLDTGLQLYWVYMCLCWLHECCIGHCALAVQTGSVHKAIAAGSHTSHCASCLSGYALGGNECECSS